MPWPVFVTLLLANGRFLRPIPFDQRIPLFVAAWIAAGLLLPMWVVALALAGWLVKVVPGIRLVNQRFQNVGSHEEPA